MIHCGLGGQFNIYVALLVIGAQALNRQHHGIAVREKNDGRVDDKIAQQESDDSNRLPWPDALFNFPLKHRSW
jgi:hypothetical protein